MIIYITVGSFERFKRIPFEGLDYDVIHIIYDKARTTIKERLPRVRPEFDSIKEQKNRVLKLGSECGETFFVMQDSDIKQLGNGIDVMHKELVENPEIDAVSLSPKPEDLAYSHPSTSCMMIRSNSVEGLQLEYESGCFCKALSKRIRVKLIKGKYIKECK